MDRKLKKFLALGLSTDLASAVVSTGLTISAIQGLSAEHLCNFYNFSEGWAEALKHAVQRKKIPSERLLKLLGNANYTCCVCKGTKSKAHLVHHIVPYEDTQDNSYENLAVLCPACHDDAHRRPGLTAGLTQSQVRAAKLEWEIAVAFGNSHKAARRFEVTSLGVDYVNVPRLQQLCHAIFGCIPETAAAGELMRRGLLSSERIFVGEEFLFDAGLSTTSHWIELVEKISSRSQFTDITKLDAHFLPALVGELGLLWGYATGTQVGEPLPGHKQIVQLRCELQNATVELLVDTKFLLTKTALYRASSRSLYALYFLVRTVEESSETGTPHVVATPLLMALPAKMVAMSDVPDIDRP